MRTFFRQNKQIAKTLSQYIFDRIFLDQILLNNLQITLT